MLTNQKTRQPEPTLPAARTASAGVGTQAMPIADTTDPRHDSRRVKAEQPIRVRSASQSSARFDDVETTKNVSRKGLFFTTHRSSYHLGMRVLVTVPYSPSGASGIEYLAEVVRMQILDLETFGVALRLLMPTGSRQ